jgi:membrane-bound ClpP family serine protease
VQVPPWRSAIERQAIVTSFQPSEPAPTYTATSTQPKNGLGIAALVLGVASLVAAVSFVLFPFALLGGLIAVILGIIALTRGRTKGATNTGQATAGVICGVLALALAIVFSVRVGTFVARNTNVFTTFDKCIAQANNRTEVSNCIATLANKIR